MRATLFASIIFSILFCSGLFSVPPLDRAAIDTLIQQQDPALQDIAYDHVQLNPQNLSITQDGIFLNTTAGERFQIDALFADAGSCFTVLNMAGSSATVYPVISCKSCGKRFSPTIFNGGNCPHCGTRN